MREWLRSLPRRDIAVAAGLQILVLVLYAATLAYPAIWDDLPYVFQEPFLQDCRNLAVVLNPRYLLYNLPVTGAARPAWLASVLADACVYSGAVAGYRLTNLLWYGLGVGALYAFLVDLLGDRRAAAFAALLYAVHPVHTETVNIVTFRGDLIALPFMLAALSLHRSYLRGEGRAAWASLAGAGACFAAALLAKETAATLPLLAALTEGFFPLGKPLSGSRRWAYGVLAGILALYIVFHIPRSGYTMGAHQDLLSSARRASPFLAGRAAPEFPLRPVPLLAEPPRPWQLVYESATARVLTMSRVWGDYLRLLVWPHPLQGDYAPAPVTSWSHRGVLLSWLSWAGLAAAAWFLRRRLPAAAYGIAWTAVALIPFSGLVALFNLQAERYLFIPSAGGSIAAGALLAAWRPRRAKEAGAVALAVLSGTFAALTAARNRDYRSNMAFHEATVRVDARVPRARFNLGECYRGAGRRAEAEAEYRAALALWPEFSLCRARLDELLSARHRGPAPARPIRSRGHGG